MGPALTLGPKGAALIKSFERLALVGYPDEGGIPTAGWGHTGPDVVIGQAYDLTQAEIWFVRDTQEAVAAVNRSLAVPVSQEQFDALAAFTFNVGIGAEAHSTLLRLVNAGDMARAAAEFPKWDHVDGIVSPGLARRRAAEQALFMSSAA